METENKECRYNIAGFLKKNDELFCHDEVIVDNMDKAVSIAKSYLKDGFLEVRITKVGE